MVHIAGKVEVNLQLSLVFISRAVPLFLSLLLLVSLRSFSSLYSLIFSLSLVALCLLLRPLILSLVLFCLSFSSPLSLSHYFLSFSYVLGLHCPSPSSPLY